MRVLDAAGCDVVIVETVGVGQSEVEVAGLADTTLVLLAPGMGDGIQAAKAGILEIGDVYAVNKADRDGADRTRRELRTMLTMAERREGAWRPPVLKTVASTGEGIDELLGELDKHAAWLDESGELARRRTARARREVEAIALAALRERWGQAGGADLDTLAGRVASGDLDPYSAADELVDEGRLSGERPVAQRSSQDLAEVVGRLPRAQQHDARAGALGDDREQVFAVLGRGDGGDDGVGLTGGHVDDLGPVLACGGSAAAAAGLEHGPRPAGNDDTSASDSPNAASGAPSAVHTSTDDRPSSSRSNIWTTGAQSSSTRPASRTSPRVPRTTGPRGDCTGRSVLAPPAPGRGCEPVRAGCSRRVRSMRTRARGRAGN